MGVCIISLCIHYTKNQKTGSGLAISQGFSDEHLAIYRVEVV